MAQEFTIKYGFSEDCKRIRTEVFLEEQGFREEFDTVDARAIHAVLYDGETPIATGRVFCEADAPDRWHIGRVAVRKPYRGKGIGAKIMRALEAAAAERGATRVWLSAQVRAAGFYRSLGYTAFGEEYLDEFCPHIAMERTLPPKTP